MFSRFSLVGGLALSTLAAFAPTAAAQVPSLDTVRLVGGLSAPLYATPAPGQPTRLYVVEQGGSGTARIKILDLTTNTILPTPFLTLTGLSTGGERGLLGLAFHPDYVTNGLLYVYVSSTASQNAVRRYTRLTADSADPASVQNVLLMSDPFSNHNGGWIDFGPDGFLYVATGDGGSANDPNGAGQNINSLLGKMLRLDINSDAFPTDPNANYAIPPTNPFAGATAGLDEIFHYGLRNPWRNGFDKLTGDLWIGDVGQNAIEEIDFQPAGIGGRNYGWRCMEGNNCTGLSGCVCNSPALTLPVRTYAHSGGACSVTGGYMYRGGAICNLQGAYFFADYCNARIWSFTFGGGTVANFTDRTAELAPGGGFAINSITSFAQDAAGELYIIDQGGEIFKIVAGGPDCNANGVVDQCDLITGTSFDTNGDGVPDECQTTVTAFCFGTAAACPCGNAGAAGNGCANSLNANGANLASSGVPSLLADNLALIGSGMPDSSALYFQGTSQAGGGLGTAFGDGLRCAGGAVIRLGTKINSGGGSSYPVGADLPVSLRGGVTIPGTRTYQVWYRNSAAFCQPEGFNLSNGLDVVWAP